MLRSERVACERAGGMRPENAAFLARRNPLSISAAAVHMRS